MLIRIVAVDGCHFVYFLFLSPFCDKLTTKATTYDIPLGTMPRTVI